MSTNILKDQEENESAPNRPDSVKINKAPMKNVEINVENNQNQILEFDGITNASPICIENSCIQEP